MITKAVFSSYKPNEIEPKWQAVWEKEKIYSPNLDTAKKPFYNLMMFPYPSAEGMHVGNMYAFTGADIYGRFKRMQGNDVFEPIGLDGFGIHSENYAIKVGRHPKEQAKVSQSNFYRQLRATGNGYDWSRTVETYDPKYYKWTQWLFIQLFKAGLAYRSKAPVNFCPSCKTVLADEQVIDEKCERCSSIVEKKDLEQWFFKITKYADRLLNGLSQIDWTEKIKIAQRQWIGKSEGTLIKFQIEHSNKEVEVFTTRADTLYGATFLVLAPEHPISTSVKDEKIQKYINQAKKQTNQERLGANREKTGVFSGLYAINPLNQEEIPIWIADYAVMGYGTGALFGDAHDERDVEFANKYGIVLKPTLITGDKQRDERIMDLKECFTGYGILINSGEFSGLESEDAKKKITEWLSKNSNGGPKITYHLRDWLISRQRYWGPPIPMINCPKCGWQPVPEDQLPVLLPDLKNWKPLGTEKSPLANHPEFYNTNCPNCKGPAKRETDVSDTFLDSAWYFLRYVNTEFDEKPFDNIRVKKWLPVNMYIGGPEHAVLHLLYSRFITMALHDLGFISFEEPYARFYAHGLLIKEGAKMSKSKGNFVIPDSYIKKYGADAFRCYLMFIGPFSQGGDFYDTGIEGMHKFLKKIWVLASGQLGNLGIGSKPNNLKTQDPNSLRMLHGTIKKVTDDIENLRYNTAIASLMEYYNYLTKSNIKNPAKGEARQRRQISKIEIETLLLLLAPFAPHMAEELYQRLGAGISNFRSVHLQLWPKYDDKFLKEDEATIAVQVNGKIRGTIKIKKSKLKNQKDVEHFASLSANVKKHLDGKKIKKVIYVEGRIINFVIE